jgi:cytosine deaminase
MVSLPSTDLYARQTTLPFAAYAGKVPIAVATNNIQNAFTPFGDGDLLKQTWLAAHINGFGSVGIAAVTTTPWRALQLKSRSGGEGVPMWHPGDEATGTLVDGESEWEIISKIPECRSVFSAGKVVLDRRTVVQ